jgi:hypothetical protein
MTLNHIFSLMTFSIGAPCFGSFRGPLPRRVEPHSQARRATD